MRKGPHLVVQTESASRRFRKPQNPADDEWNLFLQYPIEDDQETITPMTQQQIAEDNTCNSNPAGAAQVGTSNCSSRGRVGQTRYL